MLIHNIHSPREHLERPSTGVLAAGGAAASLLRRRKVRRRPAKHLRTIDTTEHTPRSTQQPSTTSASSETGATAQTSEPTRQRQVHDSTKSRATSNRPPSRTPPRTTPSLACVSSHGTAWRAYDVATWRWGRCCTESIGVRRQVAAGDGVAHARASLAADQPCNTTTTERVMQCAASDADAFHATDKPRARPHDSDSV